MVVSFDQGKVFGGSFRFYLAMAAAVYGYVQTGHNAAFVFLVILLAGVSARRGTDFNAERQQMRRYFKVFGVKFGPWEAIEPNSGVVVLKQRYRGRIFGFGGQAGGTEFERFDLFLVDESHRVKVPVGQTKDRASWDSLLEDLDRGFNLKLQTYSPAISAATRARKRRKR
ncbi:MAG: hypothetical protein RL754_755 [Bacteroidota bacterium]|jgi:hypothetical protein